MMKALVKSVSINISPGQMGENITTQGIDILGLPRNACLQIGESALK